jgi:hypothetical protein
MFCIHSACVVVVNMSHPTFTAFDSHCIFYMKIDGFFCTITFDSNQVIYSFSCPSFCEH